ncbi:MAG: flagellar assembly peptidoglycan hydrolase FlgJ [Gammaproteobacteria bacterium]
MIQQPDLYTNFSQYAEMRRQAHENSDESVTTVAKQFESLFIQMMLKTMRDSIPEGGLFGDDKTRMYQDMYDKQLSLNIASGDGIGLAAVIARQLGQQQGKDSSLQTAQSSLEHVRKKTMPAQSVSAPIDKAVGSHNPHQLANDWDSGDTYVRTIWPHAVRAGEQLGVDPEVLVAQSVLETGWGEHVRRSAEGNNSFSLFGIKADHRWQGDRVSVSTLEFHDGTMQREKAQFRAYDCVAEAFEDYVDFIQSSPRYQSALQKSGNDGYVESLQEAGYATDPDYASKIERIQNSELLNKRLSGLKNTSNPPLT